MKAVLRRRARCGGARRVGGRRRRRRSRGSGSASRSISSRRRTPATSACSCSTSTAPATRRPSCRGSTRGRRRSRRRSTRAATCSCTSSGGSGRSEHHLTLDGLQQVVPRSNDPGCSAGFGMGLVMALGPSIIAHRRQERAEDVRGAADAAAAVHVRAQPRPCAHARLPRDDLPRSQRVQRSSARATRRTARRARSTTTGSRCAVRTRRRRRCTRSRSPRQALRAVRAIRARVLVPLLDRAGAGAGDPERRATCSASAAGSPAVQRAGLHRGRGEGLLRHAGRAGAALCEPRMPRRMRSPACAASRTRRSRASRGRRSRSSASAPACRRARGAGCAAWFGQTFNVLENGRFLAHGCPDVATGVPRVRAWPARGGGASRS